MRVLIFVSLFVALASAARPSLESLRSAPLPVVWHHLHEELSDATLPSQCQSLIPDQNSLSSCQSQLPTIPTDPTSAGAPPTKAQLDAVCSSDCIRNQLPKLRGLVNCIADAGDPAAAGLIKALFGLLFTALDFTCTRDDAGQYCAIVFQQSAFKNFANNDQTCAFFASTGCCARTYVNFVLAQSASSIFSGAGGAGSTLSGAAAQFNNTVFYCGMQQGPACPKPGDLRKSIAVKWVLNNFNCTWLAAAPPATARLLFFYLAKDIAKALNVPLGAVAVSAISGCSKVVTPAVTQSVDASFPHMMLMQTGLALQAAGAVTVDYNVRGVSDASTSSLQSTVMTVSQSSSIPFTDTTSAFPAVSSGAPLANNPAAATVTTTTVGTSISAGVAAQAGWLFAMLAAVAAVLVSRV